MEIRKITKSERKAAMSLVERVFMKFEAPGYPQQGIDTFCDFISDDFVVDGLNIYGGFEGEKLIGVLAVRNESHISLFFVDEEYQGKGAGKALFAAMVSDTGMNRITVNSSPYAVNIYKKLGFTPTDTEQLRDGIRYTPMIYGK